jgi:hypothetical protein
MEAPVSRSGVLSRLPARVLVASQLSFSSALTVNGLSSMGVSRPAASLEGVVAAVRGALGARAFDGVVGKNHLGAGLGGEAPQRGGGVAGGKIEGPLRRGVGGDEQTGDGNREGEEREPGGAPGKVAGGVGRGHTSETDDDGKTPTLEGGAEAG